MNFIVKRILIYILLLSIIKILSSKSNNNEYSIFEAIRKNDLRSVKLLLKSGVNINTMDDLTHTPLTLSIMYNKLKITGFLIKQGADSNLDNPIYWVIVTNEIKEKDGIQLIKELMKKGAKIQGENIPAYVALAALRNKFNLVKFLVKSGAEIEKRTDGYTGLMLASRDGYLNIVVYLIKAGAEINVDFKGWTSLMMAVSNNHTDIITELIKANADVNIINNFGETALFYAVKNGNKKIVWMLLNAKALVKIKNNKGLTVFDYCKNCNDILEILQKVKE